MKIKDRSLEFKWSNLLFERVYTNSVLFIILAFAFINFIVGLMGVDNLDMMSIFLLNFSFLILSLGGAIGPGEALRDEYNNDKPDVNKRDLKKSMIYTLIYIIVTLSIYYIYKPEPTPPKAPINIHKKITSVKFVDLHGKKDTYAIRYYDKDGKNIFTDVYNKEVDRTHVHKKIFKNGKVAVDMDYYNRNGKEVVEISQKPINL